MRCETCQELISAALDGEVDDDERRLADRHVETCPDCDAYRADVLRLHRAVRVAPAMPVPDLTDAILERAAAERSPVAAGRDRGRHRRGRARADRGARRSDARVVALQYGLLVVALTIAALSVPELLASSGISVHESRHLGGWDLAFAVGLVLAALQPWRARGLVPMAAALGGVMVVTAGLDVSRGVTPGLAEASHLLELLGLLFLWLLARSVSDARPRRGSLTSDEPSATGPGAVARLRSLFVRAPGLPVGASTSAPTTARAGGTDAGRRAA